MYPDASLSMNMIASGVMNCAGMMRSPSFSRDSSSVTTTIRPARSSSRMSSMGENAVERAESGMVGIVAVWVCI